MYNFIFCILHVKHLRDIVLFFIANKTELLDIIMKN